MERAAMKLGISPEARSLATRSPRLLKATPALQRKPPMVLRVRIGGPKGLEPTRFGDWEKGGRCSDF
ncbi:hypothetical protein GOP47_0007596 [Adiantum capillus-veneris]|uniref:Succinate dehydrogenase assembly factor 4, mitochondrial n=1 Tax=Adiantum capillus-veneris TaxID=13818 RepID=A0A9D4V2H0_ADICA|nr:hypothetical protein GOP47_0007596 [Adiantum capillus-veneris]